MSCCCWRAHVTHILRFLLSLSISALRLITKAITSEAQREELNNQRTFSCSFVERSKHSNCWRDRLSWGGFLTRCESVESRNEMFHAVLWRSFIFGESRPVGEVYIFRFWYSIKCEAQGKIMLSVLFIFEVERAHSRAGPRFTWKLTALLVAVVPLWRTKWNEKNSISDLMNCENRVLFALSMKVNFPACARGKGQRRECAINVSMARGNCVVFSFGFTNFRQHRLSAARKCGVKFHCVFLFFLSFSGL